MKWNQLVWKLNYFQSSQLNQVICAAGIEYKKLKLTNQSQSQEMRKWGQFLLSSGQSLFVLGALDMMWGICNIFETCTVKFHKSLRNKVKVDSYLQYTEWTQLSLETLKFGCVCLFWVGGLVIGKRFVLRSWMYFTITLEVLLQVLVWISEYNHSKITVGLVLRLTYSAFVPLLIRSYFVLTLVLFLTKSQQKDEVGGVVAAPFGEESSAVPTDVEMLPVGSGALNIFRFYHADIRRSLTLLLTIDFGWGVIRVMEKEIPLILFGGGHDRALIPSSSTSTPLFVEERIIRTFRMTLDALFLSNIRHDKPPLESSLILPRIVEMIVSLGILVFLRIVDSADYTPSIFTLFYILFIADLIFRVLTFLLCYKAYGDFLCRRHRSIVTAVANLNLPQSLTIYDQP